MSNKPPLSSAIWSEGFIFLSGQIHLTSEGVLLEGSIVEQTHQVMKNIQKVLEDHDVTFDQIVKSTIYLTDMSFYPKVNEVYASYFKNDYPAREVVCVKELPLGARVEISMIAHD
jgi:2-iminobutanoate/2-iminopropanoate deaminase